MNKFTLVLKDVSPEAGPQFSPNLFRWLRKNFRGQMEEVQVFRKETGLAPGHTHLYVGYLHDGDFIGSALQTILGDGGRARLFCHPGVGHTFEPVPNFWRRYVKIGRCHIDPKHKVYFVDKRWEEGTRRRTCLWCGLVQKKVSKRKVVVETTWVAA